MSQAVRLTDLASAALLGARREIASTLNGISVYRALKTMGPGPESPLILPEDLYSPDAKRGQAFLAGHLHLAGDQIELHDLGDAWDMIMPSESFARQLHGFDWLRDVVAAQTSETDDVAADLIDRWIDEFGQWNSFVWSDTILAPRLLNWWRAGPALLGDAAPEDRRLRRINAMLAQARYLQRSMPVLSGGIARVRAGAALVLTGLCLPKQKSLLKSGLNLLERELPRQVLPDGGHISRSPVAAADILVDLITLMQTAQASSHALPDFVRRTADRLAPMVQFFRMSDGGLASFNGGGEYDAAALDQALKTVGPHARSFGVAPQSGYQRTEAGDATVLFDVGDAPGGPLSAQSHASALAFEMCAPGGRLIVNCGWRDDQASNWREAVRATAAHSTLVLEEESSAQVLQAGWKRRLLGPRFAQTTGPVSARRNEGEMGIWLDGTHEGYRGRYGLNHRRRVFLAADGGDLRGEDALFRPVSDGAPDDVDVRWSFSIRFHLHPSVRVSLSRDSLSALLVQPNGDGWRFRTDGGPLRLERSVYLAAGSPPQRSSQIVIHGEAEPYGAGDRPPNRIRWAFQRLGRIGGAEGDFA